MLDYYLSAGHTEFVISGRWRSRKALLEELLASGGGSEHLRFDPAAMAPDFISDNKQFYMATATAESQALVLRVDMRHRQDALGLADTLSVRYPGLTFRGRFWTVGHWPDFTVSLHRNGYPVYRVWFAARFAAHLCVPSHDGGSMHRGPYSLFLYPRSPARALAARDAGLGTVWSFLERPTVAGRWRQSDDPADCRRYFGRMADGSVTVLAINVCAAEGHVLSDVDGYGGYDDAETLALDDLLLRFPELAADVANLATQARVDVAGVLAAKRADAEIAATF